MVKISSSVQQQIEKGVSILKQGGLVAYPTDTVYGLGASAVIPRAIERVFEVKERPKAMPLPLLVASEDQLADLTEHVSEIAWRLIHAFMPGGLTIVLPALDSLPKIITGEGKTVAVRIPDHPIPLALIEGLGAPIVGTSANLSGQPSPLTADDVLFQLGGRIELIIDGGRSPGGKESTIVDVTGNVPVVLREGAIPISKLKEVCGEIILKKGENRCGLL